MCYSSDENSHSSVYARLLLHTTPAYRSHVGTMVEAPHIFSVLYNARITHTEHIDTCWWSKLLFSGFDNNLLYVRAAPLSPNVFYLGKQGSACLILTCLILSLARILVLPDIFCTSLSPSSYGNKHA